MHTTTKGHKTINLVARLDHTKKDHTQKTGYVGGVHMAIYSRSEMESGVSGLRSGSAADEDARV